jgi:hypothetical protein
MKEKLKVAKNITMILFLSAYNGQPESEYSTDRGFNVTGAQANEAPIKYAIRRLAEKGEQLSRVIALITHMSPVPLLRYSMNTL